MKAQHREQVIYYFLIFLGVMSVLAFCLYGSDKRKAKKGKFRTPESVLLGFSFFGGAIGALLGMKMFRHKTKHWYFWFFNILGLIWQVALPVLYVLYIFNIL